MHTISYVIAVQSAKHLYVVFFCTKVGSRHASHTEVKAQTTLLHLAVCDGQCMTSRYANDLYSHTKKKKIARELHSVVNHSNCLKCQKWSPIR